MTDCWVWVRHRNPKGYAIANWPALSKSTVVSRMVLEASLGRPLSPHEMACHTCDNPSCVNPAHIWLGDVAANAADMVEKGRTAPVSGELNPRAKLTYEQVSEARALYSAGGLSSAELARRFGVHKTTMKLALLASTWRE